MLIEPSNGLAVAVLLVSAVMLLWAAQPGWTGKRWCLHWMAAVLCWINPALLFVVVAFAGLVLWGLYHGDDFAF